MAQATSPASDQRYGIRRVCQAWGVPRSSFYAAQQPSPDNPVVPAPARRGPRTASRRDSLDDIISFIISI